MYKSSSDLSWNSFWEFKSGWKDVQPTYSSMQETNLSLFPQITYSDPEPHPQLNACEQYYWRPLFSGSHRELLAMEAVGGRERHLTFVILVLSIWFSGLLTFCPLVPPPSWVSHGQVLPVFHFEVHTSRYLLNWPRHSLHSSFACLLDTGCHLQCA